MAERRSPQLDWQIFSITSLVEKFDGASLPAMSDNIFFSKVGAKGLKLQSKRLLELNVQKIIEYIQLT